MRMSVYIAIRYKRSMIGLLAILFSSMSVSGQDLAVKTNTLWWVTGTPNIVVELPVTENQTFQLFYGINPWKSDVKSTAHWSLQSEYRYWLQHFWKGWYIGIHAMGGEFNLENKKLPFGIFRSLRNHHYEGWYAGGGYR